MRITDEILVQRIEWESNLTDMLVTCKVRNGLLEYSSILVLPGNELNRLLMQLQKQHDTLDINDCLKIEQWSEDEVQYIFDFSQFPNEEFVFKNQMDKEKIRQIRA